MAENSLNSLLEILRDRDVPYSRDAIKSVFDDPESEAVIQAWMQEYLSPETLLTRDEAALYAAFSKNGEIDALAAQDLSAIRGRNDEEIQNAIEELKRSTAVIEKQSEALRLQQNAMKSLVKNNSQTEKLRSQTNKSQLRKWNVERDHISNAIEELSQSLRYRTAELEQQSKGSEVVIKQTVDSILRADDKLLSSLQKLASDLSPARPEDDNAIARVKELCARLIKHTVEGIRTRLDRIYLEALNQAETNGHDPESQEVADLQEELESLYSEILPVAQMSAEQQFLEPALREIAARDGQGQQRSVNAVKYIHDCLNFLVNRVETFLERAEEHQSHKMALQSVINETNKELLRPEPSSPSKKASAIKSNTQKRRKSSDSKSPVRVRGIRRRSTSHEEDIEPEQQLLRNLGISIPADTKSDQKQMDILERALQDRVSKLEGHAKSLQSTTETSISSHLLDAHMTLQLLRDSLLSETLYNKVQLLDPESESAVDTFEEDVQDLQKKLDAVNLHKLQARNVHREQLVERWSR